MESTNDDWIPGFVARDHYLPHITPEAVAQALNGFAHAPISERSFDWLATAVRRALALTIHQADEGPNRQSDASIRDDLLDLGSKVWAAWQAVERRSGGVDGALWDKAWRSWIREDETTLGDPPLNRRLLAAIREMDWLAGYLTRASKEIEAQRPNWQNRILRDTRIERALYLARIFEMAFELPIVVNGFPSDARHPKPTPFMDFYQRMVALAFNEQATPDLPAVLKEANRLHKKSPAVFNEGLIPGLQ